MECFWEKKNVNQVNLIVSISNNIDFENKLKPLYFKTDVPTKEYLIEYLRLVDFYV